ncbi:hypothetical protein D3C72_1941500 [compost metagenome]
MMGAMAWAPWMPKNHSREFNAAIRAPDANGLSSDATLSGMSNCATAGMRRAQESSAITRPAVSRPGTTMFKVSRTFSLSRPSGASHVQRRRCSHAINGTVSNGEMMAMKSTSVAAASG